MTDHPIASPQRQPCPYRRFLRNVHIRRAFVVFVIPITAPIVLIAAASLGIKENVSDVFDQAIKAFKDGNSYD